MERIISLLLTCAVYVTSTGGLSTVYTTARNQQLSCGSWIPYTIEKCLHVVDITSLRTKEEAEIVCATIGEPAELAEISRPVTIKSEMEQQALQHFLFKKSGLLDNVWLGINSGDDRIFRWNNETELDFNNFAEQNTTNTDDQCVQMESGQGTYSMGQWVRVHCGEKNVVVCEKAQVWTMPQLQNIFLRFKSKVERKLEDPRMIPSNGIETHLDKMPDGVDNPFHQSPCGDWTPYKDEKCIKLVVRSGTQVKEDANFVCQGLKDFWDPVTVPKLVTVKTEEKQQFLQQLLFDKQATYDHVWLGLEIVNDTWFRWNDGTDLLFSNWVSQSVADPERRCVQMESGEGAYESGLWVRTNCKKRNAVVCEKPQTWTVTRWQNKLLALELGVERNRRESDEMLSTAKQEANEKMNTIKQETEVKISDNKREAEESTKIAKKEADQKISAVIQEMDLKINAVKQEAERIISANNAELEQKFNVFKQEAEEKIKAAETKLNLVEAEAERKTNAVKQEADRIISANNAELEQKFNDFKQETEEKIKAAEAKLNLVEAEAERKTNAVKQEADRIISANNAELEQKFNDFKQETEEKIKAAEAKLNLVEAEAERKTNAVKQEADRIISANNAELEQKFNDFKQETEEKIKAAEAKFNLVKEEAERKIKADKAESQQTFNAFQQEADEKLKAAEVLISSVKQEEEQKINATKQEVEGIINAYKAESDQKFAALKQETDEKIKAAEVKLSSAKQEAEQKINANKAECEQKMNSFKQEADGKFRSSETMIDSVRQHADQRINNLANYPVPVGFIYVQLPDQSPPSTLWPHSTWRDVSYSYAGLFFRVTGGDAASFGQVQNDNAPRLAHVDWTQTGNRGGTTQRQHSIPASGWSAYVYSGDLDGEHDMYLRFQLSTGEVRPRNKAVRIWKRTS